MSWISKTTQAAVVAGACFWASGALAGVIVVRSNGPSAPSYPPGKSLDASGSIVLKAGDVLTVLDASGTRVLRGPGRLPVAASGGASASGISALLADTGQRQSRTGATRGTSDAPPRPTNVWYIDASRSGAVCVVDPATLTLWRPDYGSAGSLKLTRLADGQSAYVDFGLGQSVKAWPVAQLPAVNGGSYRLEGAGLAAPATIRLQQLASVPASLDAAAQALMGKGCNIQMDLLIQGTQENPEG